MKPYLSPPTYALLAGYFASKRQPGCFIDEDPFSHSQMNQLGSAPIRLAPDGKVLADSAYLVTAPTFGKGTHPAKSLVLVSARHLVDDVAAVGQDGAPQLDDTIVTSLKRFSADPACHWK